MIGAWRKLLNEEIHNLYPSSSKIRMIKCRRMGWTGQIVRTARRGIHTGYWWESQKERDHKEDLDVGGNIILKRVLEM
jgi:hypothetical protein